MALNDSDVDETMAADWAAILEKHAVEEPAPTPTEPETPEPTADPEPDEEVGARARDESGKFIKASKEASDGQGKPPKAAEPGKTGATGGKVEDALAGGQGAGAQPESADLGSNGVNRDTNRAPSSWKPLARAEWDKLPSVVKAEIHRRESESHAGAQQLVPDAQFGKSLRQTIEPYRMLIEAEGGTPERAVGDLLRTAAIFRVGTPQQKLSAIAGIAQQYGVDLRPLFQPAQPGQPNSQLQSFRDPRVDQLLANQQRETAERQRREQTDMESTVNRWMNEVDAQGNATRPYISDVINDMAGLIPQLKESNPLLTNAQVLEEAYNRAIWAHPEIRTLLQQKAAADRQAELQAENQTRVREARRAASVNVPRRASTPTPGKPGTMEETIAATARELGLIST